MSGIRDEYAPSFGKQNLTLWSGAFASEREGRARELPAGDGFMVTLWDDTKIRVVCPAPRTDANFLVVDEAIRAAVWGVQNG